MHCGREEHAEDRQPAGAGEAPPGNLVLRRCCEVAADGIRDLIPPAQLADAQQSDGQQPDEHHRAVDEVGDRRAPQPAERDVGREDDRRHQDPAQHRQRCQGAEYDADDVGLDQIDDGVLRLHAQARQPLAAAMPEADREQLTDRMQLETAEVDAEEQADDRQGQERIDAVPPQVPDAAADDVARDAVGAGAADPGARDADGDQRGGHASAGDRPAGGISRPARHEAAGGGRPHEIDDDRRQRDGIHQRGAPGRQSRAVSAARMASSASRALPRISSSVAS